MRTIITLLLSFATIYGAAQSALYQNPMVFFLGNNSQDINLTGQNYLLPYDGLGQPWLLASQNVLHGRSTVLATSPLWGYTEGFGSLKVPSAQTGRTWAGFSGSHRGHFDAGGLIRKTFHRADLHTVTSANYQQMQESRDKNEDGFYDLAPFRRYFVTHRSDLRINSKLKLNIDGLLLKHHQEGGQIGVPSSLMTDSTGWMLEDDVSHWKASVMAEYQLDKKGNHQLVGGFSHREHRQSSDYGKRGNEIGEQLSEAAITYLGTDGIGSVLAKIYAQKHERQYDFGAANSIQNGDVIGLLLARKQLFKRRFFLKNTLAVEHNKRLGWQIKPVIRVDYATKSSYKFGLYVGRDYRLANLYALQQPYSFSNRKITIGDEDNFEEDILFAGLVVKTKEFGVAGLNGKIKLSYDYRKYLKGISVHLLEDENEIELRRFTVSEDIKSDRHQVVLSTVLQHYDDLQLGLHYKFTHREGISEDDLLPTVPHRLYTSLRWSGVIQNMDAHLSYVLSSPMGKGQNMNEIAPWQHQVNIMLNYTFKWRGNHSPECQIFAGAENLFNQRQQNPYQSADEPWSDDFNADKRWGSPLGIRAFVGAKVLW